VLASANSVWPSFRFFPFLMILFPQDSLLIVCLSFALFAPVTAKMKIFLWLPHDAWCRHVTREIKLSENRMEIITNEGATSINNGIILLSDNINARINALISSFPFIFFRNEGEERNYLRLSDISTTLKIRKIKGSACEQWFNLTRDTIK